ncbi:GntR family transcriptional regulator [Primorskyibacter sp. S187A]|uniref:GntR family transcriptional regulator n=1 Tax=Primorskyibacter sp. S187A TaxID=3415130 RepID=UPI003C7D31F1
MNASNPGTPAHQQVYDALRRKMLFGELAPGTAVTILGIAKDLNAGMTPVREALRRLVAAGALELQGNRRVSVPVLSAPAIDEIDHVRQAVEPELARRACLRVTPSDIARLRQIDLALDHALAAGDIGGYLGQNYRFHAALYADADAPILASITDRLWLRFGPSMRVICGRLGTAQLPDHHKAILDALAARDPHGTAQAMQADIAQGTQHLRAALDT